MARTIDPASNGALYSIGMTIVIGNVLSKAALKERNFLASSFISLVICDLKCSILVEVASITHFHIIDFLPVVIEKRAHTVDNHVVTDPVDEWFERNWFDQLGDGGKVA